MSIKRSESAILRSSICEDCQHLIGWQSFLYLSIDMWQNQLGAKVDYTLSLLLQANSDQEPSPLSMEHHRCHSPSPRVPVRARQPKCFSGDTSRSESAELLRKCCLPGVSRLSGTLCLRMENTRPKDSAATSHNFADNRGLGISLSKTRRRSFSDDSIFILSSALRIVLIEAILK